MLCFVSQPVDKHQALVRRESVVNLENFKKQYVRRRWKVRQGLGREAGGVRGAVGFLDPSEISVHVLMWQFLFSPSLSSLSASYPCVTTSPAL